MPAMAFSISALIDVMARSISANVVSAYCFFFSETLTTVPVEKSTIVASSPWSSRTRVLVK